MFLVHVGMAVFEEIQVAQPLDLNLGFALIWGEFATIVSGLKILVAICHYIYLLSSDVYLGNPEIWKSLIFRQILKLAEILKLGAILNLL